MDIKKGNRKEAVKALINTWLKFPGHVCATCGEDYIEGMPCCENPVVGTNQEALECFLKEMKIMRETRENCYGSNKDKTLRIGVSIPSNLYHFLDKSMKRLYEERLFTEKHGMQWFAKNFPQFQIPERI